MRRETRIKILHKLAKKDRKLSGRMSRKDVEKFLTDSKKAYDQASSELRAVEITIMKLKDKFDTLKEQESSTKDDMNLCHKILRNMDFAKAKEVKVRDKDDIAYSVDGKWCSYSDNEGLKKYERRKNEKLNPQPDDPEKDNEDVSDADDVNNVINKLVEVEETNEVPDDELMEGVDITV